MRLTAALLLLLITAACAEPARAQTQSRAGDVQPSVDYAADLDTLLLSVLTPDGQVRYDLLRGAHRSRLRQVLRAIETFDATGLRTRQERLAFWLNAYNVQMLVNIVEASGARDIVADGYVEQFFRTPRLTAGLAMTLDQLEHVVLRGQDGPQELRRLSLERLDPRIHVGLNCAAVGCPRLQARAFRPGNVDRQLDEAMRQFVNDERHFRREGRNWVFSSLIDWFAHDFDDARTAGDFLIGYLDPTRPDAEALHRLLAGKPASLLRQDRRIRFEYDWRVNAAPVR